MNRLILATLAALLAAPACTTSEPVRYALVPVQSNGADLPGLDSQTILESRQPGGIVSVRADERFDFFGAGFFVAVHNKSGGPVDFGPENVQASIDGHAIPVLAADELDAKLKGRIRGRLRSTSRTDTVDIENASAEVEREYRFNNYGGCPAGQGTCQIFSADGGSGYRQDRINRELQAKTIAEAALTLQTGQAMIQRALRPALVAPEQMSGGVIVVEPPKRGGKVDLVVTFNGRKHSFTFTATPAA
ncbi:MAG TPA: hypothetical protein VFV70_08810 [Hyphomonadaceae bacterium]|nr:hypothetical protein [Hyphomonadaceae bacterium]